MSTRSNRFLTCLRAYTHRQAGAARKEKGFSLAEIMVAIAILSIGLLMAAAAFPTGLDQTRIITELSTAPLVAQEAVNIIKRELDVYKKTFPGTWEIWKERWTIFTSPIPPGEPSNLYTIRPPGAGAFTPPSMQVLFSKSFMNLQGYPVFERGKHIRAYPFGTPFEKARYSWTYLMKFVEGTDVVHLLVFVQSGGQAAELRRFNGFIEEESSTGFQRLLVNLNNPQNVDLITEGAVLVRQQDGVMITVAARDDDPPGTPAPNTAYFFLNGKVEMFGSSRRPIVAWILPVDPDTGRAKVIGTYQYYLSL